MVNIKKDPFRFVCSGKSENSQMSQKKANFWRISNNKIIFDNGADWWRVVEREKRETKVTHACFERL